MSETKIIYKYSSLNGAIKILKSGSVLLNEPRYFNDPFDSRIVVDNATQKKTIDLITNYFTFKIFSDFVARNDLMLQGFQKELVKLVAFEVSLCKKMIRRTKCYEPMPFFTKAIYKFSELNKEMREAKQSADEKFNGEMMTLISSMRSKVRISCFSKRNDSILMWSHYADSHHGVCFEFKERRNFFNEVTYSNEKPILDIYSATQRILAYDYINEKIDYSDKKFAEKMLRPFYVKSPDWSYEQEIRCVLSDTEPNTEGYFYQDNHSFLKMNISKIYIGAEASGEKLNEVLLLAKKWEIPVIFMKEDEQTFSIVPDEKKRINLHEAVEKKLNSLEVLQDEINECLNSNCYIAALSLALSIPSLLGRLIYPNLEEKEAYIRWYQENLGMFSHSEESERIKLPYPSGELCYSLKNAIQNQCDTKIDNTYSDFRLDDFKLRVEKKNYFDIYATIPSYKHNCFTDESKYSLEFSIRDFCSKILALVDSFLKDNRKYAIPSFSIERFDKKVDELNVWEAISDAKKRAIQNKKSK